MGRAENRVKDAIIGKWGGGDDILMYKVSNVFIRTAEGRGVRGGTIRGFSDVLFGRNLLILPQHVGREILQFGLCETKSIDGKTEKVLQQLQQNTIDNVNRMGGIAGRARCVEDFQTILDSWDLRYAG